MDAEEGEPSASEEAGQLKEFEVKLEELSDAEGEGHASEEPSPPPTRTSSRRRKPVKRFEFGQFAEVKTEEYNDVKQEFGDDEEQNMEEQEHDDEVDMEEAEYQREEYSPYSSSSIDPRRSTSPSGRIRRLRVFFSPEERCDIFRFILSECKSKTPGREGRVGKQKVQIMCAKFWDKFKALYGYERRVDVYRLHYNLYSKKLHSVPGLTLEERVDLYYAMEMPVTDRKERAVLIEKFGVTIDKQNIVRGSTVLQHWDYTDEGSDEEEEEEFRDNLPYVEYHDGLQWQFMVDRINAGHDPLVYGSKLWRLFREHYKTLPLIRNKAYLGYASRCRRLLLPNLHIMPFDMEAKAALYESLEYPVPHEFREELITATSVELSPSGYIEEYATRPSEIILQSHAHQSPIGLTSRTTYSTLREPEGWHLIPEDDRTPWNKSEDRQILEWVRAKAVDAETGRLTKIQVPRKMAEAMEYWKKYREEHKTERGLRTLATRFHRLREDLSNSNAIDSKMKLELYYILSKPVDVEAGEIFKAFSILVIDEDARIRFALAVDDLLGRTDGELIDEDKYSFFYDIRMLRKLVGRSKIFDKYDPEEQIEIGRQIMERIEQREWQEQQKMSASSNSLKFPYCGREPVKQLPRMLKRSNQQISHSSYLEPAKRHANKFETMGGIDWDGDNQQGPSSSSTHPESSAPPIKLSDAMKSVEMSISVVKMHIARFHAELRTASKTMTDERRLECLTEIEQLTRMFRFSGKQALTLPEPPKPPKQPKEKKMTN